MAHSPMNEPPDYTPVSGGTLPSPPPYSEWAAPPPLPARNTRPSRPASQPPPSQPSGSSGQEPERTAYAGPSAPQPHRQHSADDAAAATHKSSRARRTSWRRAVDTMSGAMRSLDISPRSPSNRDKPLPAVPPVGGAPDPSRGKGEVHSNGVASATTPASASAPQRSAAGGTSARHPKGTSQTHSAPPPRTAPTPPAPPLPPRPTGEPAYPPVSSYRITSTLAPRPDVSSARAHAQQPAQRLNARNYAQAFTQAFPPMNQQQPTQQRRDPAPNGVAYRHSALFAPNPTIAPHQPPRAHHHHHHPARSHSHPPPLHSAPALAHPPPAQRPAQTTVPVPAQAQAPRLPVSRVPSRPPPPPPKQPQTATPGPSPPSKQTSAAKTTTTSSPATTPRKKLTKYVAKSPSGVSFASSLYAAATPSKKATSSSAKPAKSSPRHRDQAVIDLTLDSDEYTPSSGSEEGAGEGSARRHRRAASQPAVRTPVRAKGKGTASTPQSAPKRPKPRQIDSSDTASSGSIGPALGAPVRCAGFTRSGQPCKRLVRQRAPLLASLGTDDDGDAPRASATGRYCRDHAGLVCSTPGFYWRDARGKAGVYINFADFIPTDLGQQTQALLRVTMESPLTAKDTPGFLYAYELRDRGSSSTAYYKVGRTDNVPRRIGQWTKQCNSHSPTLRDVFPLRAPPGVASRAGGSAGGLTRQASVLSSLLPGATKAGTDAARMVPAVKRWERLVHLELADRATAQRPNDYDTLLSPCADCGTVHREIFPLAETGRAYEDVVVNAIERWEKFVRAITA